MRPAFRVGPGLAPVIALAKARPRIPGALARLAELAERGLVEIDHGEADERRARTENYYKRTDRLRGGGHEEPAIKQAVGRSKQRRALLDHLELASAGGWVSYGELRAAFPRAKALLGALIDAGLVAQQERLRELDPFDADREGAAAPDAGVATKFTTDSFGDLY